LSNDSILIFLFRKNQMTVDGLHLITSIVEE
jgi:hypothetical protein